MMRSFLPILLVAGLVGACGTGPRVSSISVPTAGPQNASDMVATWDAQKQAEVRCSYDQAGQQIGVDGMKGTKTVSPACGDYKK